MVLEDRSLTCRDCACTFIFTAGEQAFYMEKGLVNQPQRCPTCRSLRRRDRTAAGGAPREMTTVKCAECGGTATVPFVPRFDKPVYCSGCFEAAHVIAAR